MARISVELPSILVPVAGGAESIAMEASTLRDAFSELVLLQPALRVHLFDEDGQLRRHVLCFHNRTNTRWLKTDAVALADGDRIFFMQAVSGG